MRKGGLSNEIRGGQQARQQAAHQLYQKSIRDHDDELMNEDGGPADAGYGVPELSPEDVEVGVEADVEHDVLYGPEAGEIQGNLERNPEARRRMLANVHRSKARFTQVLRLQKHDAKQEDGSLQEMTKMLLDLEFGKTRDHRENVTSIIDNLADQKDMRTPHDDDEKWADMFTALDRHGQ